MDGGLLGLFAPFQVCRHVLQDDDGVVHHHAYGYGQGGHRDDIQRIAGGEQVDQGRQEGDRDGQDDDEGAPPPAQEHVHHEHHHEEGDQDGLLQGVDRVQDVVGGVHDRRDLDVRREVPLQLLHLLLDAADHVHGIVAGLLLDDDLRTADPVRVGLLGALFQAVLHAGDIAEIHGAPVVRAQDDVVQFRRVLKLLLDAEGIGVGADVDVAGRDVPVLGGDDLGNGGDGKPVSLQLGGVAIDLDLSLRGAGHGDRTHAGDAGERGGHAVVQDLVQGGDALVGGGGHDHDGHVVHAELEDRRGGRPVGERLGNHAQLVAHVVRRDFDVRSVVEFQGEDGDVLPRVGRDVLEVRNAVQGVFEDLREVVLHVLGAGTGVGGHDHDDVGLHVREVVHGEPRQREDAQDGERHEHQGGRHRMVDGSSVNAHGRPPYWLRTRTFTPSLRAAWPFWTMSSPSWMPSMTSYSKAVCLPRVTGT